MRSSTRTWAGSEPKKRNKSMVVAKTCDHTQAEDNITSRRETLCALGASYSSEVKFTTMGRVVSRSSYGLASQNGFWKSARRKVTPWELSNKLDKAVEV